MKKVTLVNIVVERSKAVGVVSRVSDYVQSVYLKGVYSIIVTRVTSNALHDTFLHYYVLDDCCVF